MSTRFTEGGLRWTAWTIVGRGTPLPDRVGDCSARTAQGKAMNREPNHRLSGTSRAAILSQKGIHFVTSQHR